jgi:hypothetical protein
MSLVLQLSGETTLQQIREAVRILGVCTFTFDISESDQPSFLLQKKNTTSETENVDYTELVETTEESKEIEESDLPRVETPKVETPRAETPRVETPVDEEIYAIESVNVDEGNKRQKCEDVCEDENFDLEPMEIEDEEYWRGHLN